MDNLDENSLRLLIKVTCDEYLSVVSCELNSLSIRPCGALPLPPIHIHGAIRM